MSIGQCYHNLIFTLISRWRYDPQLILIDGAVQVRIVIMGQLFGAGWIMQSGFTKYFLFQGESVGDVMTVTQH